MISEDESLCRLPVGSLKFLVLSHGATLFTRVKINLITPSILLVMKFLIISSLYTQSGFFVVVMKYFSSICSVISRTWRQTPVLTFFSISFIVDSFYISNKIQKAEFDVRSIENDALALTKKLFIKILKRLNRSHFPA